MTAFSFICPSRRVLIAAASGTAIALASQTTGFGGGCGGGSSIEINVESPCCSDPSNAKEDDVLIRSVVWDDGSEFDEFVFASSVSDVQYEGPSNRLRVITGHDCEVGDPGVFNIQDEDGNGSSISSEDLSLFADRILNAWNHENLNAYIHRRSSAYFSCTVEFEEIIRDNSPLADEIGELIIFELSGNSKIQIEALDEAGEVIGTPVVIEDYKKVSPERLYTRKYSNSGNPLCGSYELKATGLDLSDLGVNEVKTLRFRSPESSCGSDVKASFRVVGVKTSSLPTAAMVFD